MNAPLQLLSVVIPVRDEEKCIGETVDNLHSTLSAREIPHEIIVVDDHSADETWKLLKTLNQKFSELRILQNKNKPGYGRAVVCGLDAVKGDAVVVTMGDGSDDSADVARYWEKLSEGFDCVFGSRFISGAKVADYPLPKLILNRLANWILKIVFRIRLNDTTNAFKAYRKRVIDGCQPLVAPHFDLTVEIPLKAIVRGYSWTVIPVSWRNRKEGISKLHLREMGSRYFFTCFSVWREKCLVKKREN